MEAPKHLTLGRSLHHRNATSSARVVPLRARFFVFKNCGKSSLGQPSASAGYGGFHQKTDPSTFSSQFVTEPWVRPSKPGAITRFISPSMQALKLFTHP